MAKRKILKDLEMEDGGVIEAPDSEGVIRYRDEDGNLTGLWRPGDNDYGRYLDLFATPNRQSRKR